MATLGVTLSNKTTRVLKTRQRKHRSSSSSAEATSNIQEISSIIVFFGGVFRGRTVCLISRLRVSPRRRTLNAAFAFHRTTSLDEDFLKKKSFNTFTSTPDSPSLKSLLVSSSSFLFFGLLDRSDYWTIIGLTITLDLQGVGLQLGTRNSDIHYWTIGLLLDYY